MYAEQLTRDLRLHLHRCGWFHGANGVDLERCGFLRRNCHADRDKRGAACGLHLGHTIGRHPSLNNTILLFTGGELL
jgi:hypothetical protein